MSSAAVVIGAFRVKKKCGNEKENRRKKTTTKRPTAAVLSKLEKVRCDSVSKLKMIDCTQLFEVCQINEREDIYF